MAETRLFAHRPLCLFPVSACAYFCVSFFSQEPRHGKSNKYYTHIHHTKLQYFLHWLHFGSVRTESSTKSHSLGEHSFSSSFICLSRFVSFSKPFFSYCLFQNICLCVSVTRCVLSFNHFTMQSIFMHAMVRIKSYHTYSSHCEHI